MNGNIVSSWKRDAVLCTIVNELIDTYRCHTIIIYGSRARGDFTLTSDYDVAGASDSISEKQWIARFDEKHQVFHDIFIFPETELITPNETHLQMSDGVVLLESNQFGQQLLKKLQILIQQPPSITDNEIAGRKMWYKKMLSRAEISDIEGKYRQLWTIYTILEDYFVFHRQRYLGPKKAFQYLEKHDPTVFILFENALADANDIVRLKVLIQTIINDTSEK